MKQSTREARRKRHLLYARACNVHAFVPSPEQIDAAQDRTEGMVALFMHYGAQAAHLPTLVRSAYLQGVWDAGCAMALLKK